MGLLKVGYEFLGKPACMNFVFGFFFFADFENLVEGYFIFYFIYIVNKKIAFKYIYVAW